MTKAHILKPWLVRRMESEEDPSDPLHLEDALRAVSTPSVAREWRDAFESAEIAILEGQSLAC